ncbi:MAG: SIR2 family protein [Acetatifactor sp.]|nr:SIR2 family protein [Acetatifactor sp.]
MDKGAENQEAANKVRQILESAPPMLFLGAGFSVGASNEFGEIPLGKGLKEEIVAKFIQGQVGEEELREIEQYELQDVCEYVDDSLGKKEELRNFLVNRLGKVEPAEFHYGLTAYPWRKIYTVNIDDLVERIYRRDSQTLLIQNKSFQKKGSGTELEYIKLHGCVNGQHEDLVFSRREYQDLTSGRMNFKLNEVGRDIRQENFVFIGASLDEADIDYYITMYEQAKYFKRGTKIFVDPKPSIKFQNRVKSFSGILLKWTAEQFMEFLGTIQYNPDELEKRVGRLNYSGIHLYRDIIKCLPAKDAYESKLYQGYNCKWQDVRENWLFESPVFEALQQKIRQLDYQNGNTYCIALYGNGLSGKGCLLKQTGAWLDSEGYTVMEFTGKSLDIDKMFEFMLLDQGKRYALLMEDAAFNYVLIEEMYEKNDTGKQLLILAASRHYHHFKKRYYLEGNPYEDFEVEDRLNDPYARAIYRKLTEKGYLGELPRQEEEGCVQIKRHKILSNVFVAITYGRQFQNRVQESINALLKDYNEQSMRLFKELTLFEMIDLPYYPKEMLTDRYSIDFSCFDSEGTENESESEAAIVDFVRQNAEGVMLKNMVLLKEVGKLTTLEEKKEIALSVLKYIAPYFSEGDINYWRVIFESFLKEDVLEKKLKFNLADILDLYYRLKEEYRNISYYWLQMGIVEQRKREYAKALNHLQMAKKIRPNAYQIQHAIARNYMKQANDTKDPAEAAALFRTGETKMFELINSHEYHKDKAKSYSIHCYVLEKIRYLEKHGGKLSNDDIRKMKRLIDPILDIHDVYIDGLLREFIKMLMKRNRLDAITFKPGDKYWIAWSKLNHPKEAPADTEEMEDVLVESY